MNDKLPDHVFKLDISEPYVHTDYNGKECILQNETLYRDGVEVSYTERLLDPDPSEPKKFKTRLTNPN